MGNVRESREFYIDHDGIALHAKLDFPAGMREGEKCPLLIVVHGFTGHMEERHIIAAAQSACEAGVAALRVEMYGHGKSGGCFRAHTVLKWICGLQTVIEYASKLDFVTNLYLAGHSQGGLATVLAGGMYADKLRAIIPLSPAISIKADSLKGSTLGSAYDPDHIPDRVVFPDGKELNGAYFRAAQLLPIDEAVSRYKGPVLIVHGDEDEAVPFACARELEAKYQNAQLKVIPGDDHCYDRHLEMVTEAVADFLKKMEGDF